MGWGPKAPDTSGMNRAAETNAAIAGRAQDLAEREYTDAQVRQDRFDPLFEQIISQSMASQSTQDARSAEQWDLYREIGLPAERRLADAAANYDTPERRALEAEGAVAAVDQQFGRQREAQQRDLGRTGSSMTANRALTLDSASRFANAKASAAADRNARRVTEATGLSLTDAVANRGRGIASTGLQAAQLALSGGGQASGQLGQQQNTYSSSLAPTQGFYGTAIGANSSAGNIYGNIANIQSRANEGAMSGLLGLGKLGAMLYTSDPKSKAVHGKVNPKAALRSLEDADVYDWTYKPGMGDGGRHIGRMAGKGDADAPDGTKAIDAISELGTHHAAIKQLAKEVRRLGLADASDVKITRRAA